MKQFSICVLIALIVLLCGCHSSAGAAAPTRPPLPDSSAAEPSVPPTEPSVSENAGDTEVVPPSVRKDGQLKGRAADADAAQEIAELYGITLVDCQNGLALFFTEEDPEAVVRRGIENGWPELTLNHSFTFS